MTKAQFLLYLGKRIKQLRRHNKLSQHQLAIRCNFEKANMSRIESGKVNITILTLRKIAKGLNVEVAELFRTRRKWK